MWQEYYSQFPRLSKFSLGTKVDHLYTDFVELILLAGYARTEQKSPFLTRASVKLDLLKFFLQVAWEMKYIDHKKYGALSVPLNEVGKMLGGWKKQAQTKQTASSIR